MTDEKTTPELNDAEETALAELDEQEIEALGRGNAETGSDAAAGADADDAGADAEAVSDAAGEVSVAVATDQEAGEGSDAEPEDSDAPGQEAGEGSDADAEDSDAPDRDADTDAADEVAVSEGAAAVAAAGGDGDGGDGGDEPGDGAAAEDEEGDEGLAEMGLMDHLDELRVRMMRAAIAFVIGTCACYAFAEQIFGYLILPLKSVIGETEHLIYTGLAEGFITYIKLGAIAGFFVMSPYIFYQFWAFVAPGLYKEERRWVIPIALFTALFFVAGSCFGYYKVFPIAFEFFAGFENESIKMLPAVKEYLSLAIKLLFAFGFAFELPLVIFFLARLGVVNSKGLRQKRKYAVLMAFIVAAILTPPDPFSQCLMAGPLIVLYEVGIWAAHFFGKKEPRNQTAEESA